MVVSPSNHQNICATFLQAIKRLLLSIKAELENVTNLVPASDSFEYFFQVAESLGAGVIPAELSPR